MSLLTKYDLMNNPDVVQPLGSAKGAANKPTKIVFDMYGLFLANANIDVMCKNLYNVYQQNGGQSNKGKFRDLVILLQQKFLRTTNLGSYELAESNGDKTNYVEVLRAINVDYMKFVYNYFKWNVYNPFHDLVDVDDISSGVSGKRCLKKGSEMRPEDYGSLDLWRSQITQVSNKNFRNNNKIPVYQAGLHTRNYDRDGGGLKYDKDQSSLENQVHGYDMREPRRSVLNYKSDEWFGFH